MKLSKFPAKEKEKEARKVEKWEKRTLQKVEVKTAVSHLNQTMISQFCFLYMPELRKLISCIWIRRLRSVQPVNDFVASFNS